MEKYGWLSSWQIFKKKVKVKDWKTYFNVKNLSFISSQKVNIHHFSFQHFVLK